MSSQEVMREYQQYIKTDPLSPYVFMKNKDRREFFRRSIIALDDNSYQIRYTTTDVMDGIRKKPKHWIAVLAFTYSEDNIPQTDEHKFLNIVGFEVTSYQREQEIIYEGG